MESTQTTLASSNGTEAARAVLRGETAKPFFPSGAIAFFVLLVALCAAIWFGIYFIMLNRI